MLCTHSLLGFVWFSAPQPISNRIESSDNKTKKIPSHSYANSLSCGHLHVTFIIFVVVFVPTDSLWLAIFTFIQLHAITIFSFRCIPLCWAKLFRLFVVERTAVSLVSYANCMQTFIIWVESIYTADRKSDVEESKAKFQVFDVDIVIKRCSINVTNCQVYAFQLKLAWFSFVKDVKFHGIKCFCHIRKWYVIHKTTHNYDSLSSIGDLKI